MYKCNCGREFEKKSSLISHGGKCKLYKKKEKKKLKYKVGDKYVCECGKEFDNHQSLNAHFSHCVVHRNGKEPKSRWKESCCWNKGLTKETSESVKQYANAIGKKWQNGEYEPRNHTDETKKKISDARILYLENNHHHGLKWFKVSNGKYDIKVQGTWELKVANWLNKNSIFWKRHSIKYGNRKYTPDFYIPLYDIYIEVKGWMKDRDISKMYCVLETNKIDIRLIEQNEIEKLSTLNINELPKFISRYKKDDIDYDKFKIRY